MVQVRDKAMLLGVTTDQLQAIGDAGSDFALTQDQVNKGLERFASVLEDVKRGQGTFFDLALKIDPALARQLATTENLSEALEILARLSDKAGTSQARLASEAFGRRNSNVLLLVQSLAANGGVDKVTEAFKKSGDAIDKEMIEKVAKLKTQIDDTADDARRNIASIFAPAVLEGQLKLVDGFREFSRMAREFYGSSSLTATLDALKFLANPAAGIANVVGRIAGRKMFGDGGDADTAQVEALHSRIAYLRRAIADESKLGNPDAGAIKFMSEEIAKLEAQLTAAEKKVQRLGPPTPVDNVPMPRARPEAESTPRSNPQVELAIYQKTVAALGAAITPAEQLKLKELELAAAAETAGVSHETVTRAINAFKLAQELAAVATRQRIGVLSEEELLSARLAELQDLRAKGFIKSAAEMQAAEQIVRKEVRETMEALEVRGSATPALTKLKQDTADLRGELDQGLAGALRGSTSEMWNMLRGTQSLDGGVTSLVETLAAATAQAILYKTVIGPIAGWAASAITSFIPGGGLPTPESLPSLEGANAAFSAKGNVFQPFADGGAFTNGIFSRPTMFGFRKGGAMRLGVMGEAGDEAVMPLDRDANGRLGVRASMPGATVVAPQINFTVIDKAGVDVKPSQPEADGKGGFNLNVLIDTIDGALADRQSSGSGKHAKVLRNEFGVKRAFA
jgi:hypothetical protein